MPIVRRGARCTRRMGYVQQVFVSFEYKRSLISGIAGNAYINIHLNQ